MAEPNEIIVGPAEVYVAPVGTTFPAVTAAPTGDWLLVGRAGSNNYTEDGVTIRNPKTTNPIRMLGSIFPRKFAITESQFEVEFNVADLSPAAMMLGYGGNPADVQMAGSQQRIEVPTSSVPLAFAVLVRVEGQSPLKDGGNMQWELSNCIQGGNGEGTFTKQDAFAQGHLWQAFEDSDGNFVALVAEDESSS